MASKTKVAYVCAECGYQTPKWMGKCPNCSAWNTLTEEIIQAEISQNKYKADYKSVKAEKITEISAVNEHRTVTGIAELDRVLGGGIVKGSVTLLSGDPGIGKSTILLQICNKLPQDIKILYVSGEESAVQIKIRADRLGVSNENLFLMADTDTMSICEYVTETKPDIVMIDSIQTMNISELSSSPGSLVQVRESANMFLRVAKNNDIPFIIVGHVNKGGDIAGPKVMEHIVDTVLYFEGERNQSYRILRGIKNRFGSTNEIGVFDMSDKGLIEVENPSAMLLSGRAKNVSGSVITCVMEGTRPILAEVQGLVTTTGFGNPKRMATGFDFNRMCLLLAVLEKRIGLYFSNLDAYLNIVGGLRLDEPAADLAVVMSLVSGLRDIPMDEKTIVFGEVGLSGEVRSVPRVVSRIKEAERLGFERIILPKSCLSQLSDTPFSVELVGVSNVFQALKFIN